MEIILSHLTGNANVKGAIDGFKEANLLSNFYVTIASFQGGFFDYLSRISSFSEIRRRQFDLSFKPFIRTWPWFEMCRLASYKSGISKLVQHESSPFFIDSVVHNLDKHVASCLAKHATKGVKAFYGYEDVSIHSFREAKRLGLKCFYDLPIGYWRAGNEIMKNESLKWPEWVATIPSLRDSEKKLKQKDQEIALASCIFVASTFTANTLTRFPGDLPMVKVIPYGFPQVNNSKYKAVAKIKTPIKILFVGSLSQRKGIANLFAAVEKFQPHVKLTLVGQKSTNNCIALNTALAKHHWIPTLPNEKVLELMRGHDILVFPSNFEGFGLVITEAMSQGTPVITTNHTAGPDLITHEKNGWLIEAGSTEALEKVIENVLCNPSGIAEVGYEALQTARRRPWRMYGEELATAVKALL